MSLCKILLGCVLVGPGMLINVDDLNSFFGPVNLGSKGSTRQHSDTWGE